MTSAVTNLYIVWHRTEQDVAILVAARCADEAVRLIQEEVWGGYSHWELANTTTRRVMRNIGEEPMIITAVKMRADGNFRKHTTRAHFPAHRRHA